MTATYRRYLTILLGAVLAMAISIAGFAFWLAPPSGDLVRIGGWSDRAFGWRGTKSGFSEDYYERHTMADLLAHDATGEILIFGDSFSTKKQGSITWINTLHEKTGRPVSFLRLNSFSDVLRYLKSDAFQSTPPAAILVQSVERETVPRAAAIHDPALPCEVLTAPLTLRPAHTTRADLPRRPFSRRTQFDSFDEVFSWGALALRKRLENASEALPIQLNRDGLFSNQADRQMLIYIDDIRKHTADAFPGNDPEAAAAKARCGLRQMITQGGKVPIRFMIAPDKRSIYEAWITKPLPRKSIDVFALSRMSLGTAYIDLLAPLTEAAGTTMDVYYPNDTHWGPIGHTIAGVKAANSLLTVSP